METHPTSFAAMQHEGSDALSDEELLQRHRKGEGGAFSALMGRLQGPLRGYLVRCGLDGATQDDLLQEIFTKVHKSAESYEPTRPLRVWVFTIAANTARSHFRSRAHRDALATSHGEGAGWDAPDGGPSHQQVVEAKELSDWLLAEISKLPVPQREALVLSRVDGLAHEDIAAILDVPIGTVKTNVRRARFALAKALARRQARLQREVGA